MNKKKTNDQKEINKFKITIIATKQHINLKNIENNQKI